MSKTLEKKLAAFFIGGSSLELTREEAERITVVCSFTSDKMWVEVRPSA